MPAAAAGMKVQPGLCVLHSAQVDKSTLTACGLRAQSGQETFGALPSTAVHSTGQMPCYSAGVLFVLCSVQDFSLNTLTQFLTKRRLLYQLPSV